MLIYELLLLVGMIGLVAMAAMGMVHTGHGHGGNGHLGHGNHGALGHGAHAGGHGALDAHAGHLAHGGHGAHGEVIGHGAHGGEIAHSHHGAHHDGHPAHAGGHEAHAGEQAPAGPHLEWLAVLSPLTLFGMAVGAGATGIAMRSLGLPPPITALAACGGAVAFRAGVVGPLWNLVSAFASRPAAALDGVLLQTAEALSAFNARGEGLVRLVVDGQERDVLARLEPGDQGARVARGEQLCVESVDSHTNSVTVSRR